MSHQIYRIQLHILLTRNNKIAPTKIKYSTPHELPKIIKVIFLAQKFRKSICNTLCEIFIGRIDFSKHFIFSQAGHETLPWEFQKQK